MELRFLQPHLRQLERSVSEVLVLSVSEGERPPRGVAGLVDYRLAGSISALIKRGELLGRVNEQVLITGKPRLPFEKILLVGAGPADRFNPQVFISVIDCVFMTLQSLKLRRAAIELPGRVHQSIEGEAAISLLKERAQAYPLLDTLTIIDKELVK